MRKIQPSENQLILVTFILVVIMAFPTFQTLAHKEDVAPFQDTFLTASEGERVPASVAEKINMRPQKVVERFAELDINCSDSAPVPQTIAGDFLRLKGNYCFENSNESGLEIFNSSNGYTASIFQNGERQYQTDLIQLQQGANKITIRYRKKSGKITEQVLVVQSTAI